MRRTGPRLSRRVTRRAARGTPRCREASPAACPEASQEQRRDVAGRCVGSAATGRGAGTAEPASSSSTAAPRRGVKGGSSNSHPGRAQSRRTSRCAPPRQSTTRTGLVRGVINRRTETTRLPVPTASASQRSVRSGGCRRRGSLAAPPRASAPSRPIAALRILDTDNPPSLVHLDSSIGAPWRRRSREESEAERSASARHETEVSRAVASPSPLRDDPRVTLTGHATVLLVEDVRRASAYYRYALGFEVEPYDRIPEHYAYARRDGCHVHLPASRAPERDRTAMLRRLTCSTSTSGSTTSTSFTRSSSGELPSSFTVSGTRVMGSASSAFAIATAISSPSASGLGRHPAGGLGWVETTAWDGVECSTVSAGRPRTRPATA